MLRLPLDHRLRCGCFPAALILVALIAAALSTRGWLWDKEVAPASTVSGATETRTAAVVPSATATLPHVTSTRPPEPAETAPLVEATATQPSVPTWTVAATETVRPTETPKPTSTPLPTETPPPATPTPTPAPSLVPSPAATGVASTGVACDAAIVSAIERALAAQAAYMRGELAAGALVETWGDAADTAQMQADRMIHYGDATIAQAEIVEVSWSMGACLARAYEGWVQVMLGTRWRYDAQLTCADGTGKMGSWVETFPAEAYALVRGDAGWQIVSWLTGAAVGESRWACP